MEKYNKNMVKRGFTTVLLTTSILLGSSFVSDLPLSSIEVSAATTTKYTTTHALNLRATNSTKGKILLTIPKNKAVTYVSKSGSWYKVKYNGKTGWVSSKYIKKVTSTTPKAASTTKTVYKTTAALNLRTTNSTKGKVLLTIPKNKAVTYVSKSGSWYKVKYNGKTGWVSSKYIKTVKSSKTATSTSTTKTTYTTTGNLNLRATNSTKGKVLLTVPKGKAVTYISKSGSWYKVKYNGKTGWVSSSYIKKVTSSTNTKKASTTKTTTPAKAAATTKKTTYTTTANLNLRATNSSKGKVLLTIPKGKTVTYISKSGSWYKVTYNGKTGWVSSNYVKASTNVTSKTTSTETKSSTTTGNSEKTTEKTSTNTGSTSGNSNVISEPKSGNTSGTNPSSPSTSNESETKIPLPAGQTITSMTVYTTNDLNLRASNSASTTLLDLIPENTKLTTNYKATNGWYKVTYKGETGFVSGSYLVSESEKKRFTALESNKNSYLFMDLRTKSSVKATQINDYIKNQVGSNPSVLLNTGTYFVEAGEKYGVNALFLAAHAIHESNFGKSKIALDRYNLFGFGAYDLVPYIGSVKFASIQQNIEFIAQSVKATYLGNDWRNQGEYLGYSVKNVLGTRVDSLSKGMNFYYATDSNWGNAIASHMTKILDYSKEKAVGKNPNTKAVAKPSYPNLSDVFPNNTLAIANSTLTLYSTKSTSTKVATTIPKNAEFNLLEKDNQYWLTVKYNKKTYYTTVAFSQYNTYFTVKNLARVTASELNVRKDANVTAKRIGIVKNKDYIELALDTKNVPITKNGWYKIVLDGEYGWVSDDYVIRELNR